METLELTGFLVCFVHTLIKVKGSIYHKEPEQNTHINIEFPILRSVKKKRNFQKV